MITSSSYDAILERVDQIVLIDDVATRDIHKHDVGFHFLEFREIEKPLGVFGGRARDQKNVRLGQERVQIDVLAVVASARLRVLLAIVVDDATDAEILQTMYHTQTWVIII